MRKILYLAVLLSLVIGCGVTKRTVVVDHITETHYIDSTRWHDSTIYYTIPVERYRDYASLLDTLKLETTYAKAEAYLDTANTVLRGTIENKSDAPVKTQIKWKEKIVYRDSTVIKEVPVEVTKEVIKYPKTYWWFMAMSIAALVYIILKVYLKFKKI